jgi:hypothetical protein
MERLDFAEVILEQVSAFIGVFVTRDQGGHTERDLELFACTKGAIRWSGAGFIGLVGDRSGSR